MPNSRETIRKETEYRDREVGAGGVGVVKIRNSGRSNKNEGGTSELRLRE